ncbi:MAG: M20/M25/M40 family metallo-hydrolase [Planctomycetota bacterium]
MRSLRAVADVLLVFGALAIPFHESGLSAQDLRLENVRVVTGTGIDPVLDVLEVRDGRIVEPGTVGLTGDTRVIRFDEPACVVPGLVDAHAHLIGLGEAKVEVDLVGTASYDEILRRVVQRSKELPEGAWILGRGWDQNDWVEQAFPDHRRLSEAVPSHPVLLTRIDGHAALANAEAMRLAEIDGETSDPSGGRLIRREGGTPTGVLIDNAQGLVRAVVPVATESQIREALLAAQETCLNLGLTTVHDAGLGGRTLQVLRRLHAEGEWTLRVYAMVPASSVEEIRRGPWATEDGVITVRAVKAYADGALGSRGAAMLDPYSDEPGTRGLLLTPAAELERTAQLCVEHGFQLCVHAIGDRANRIVLDVFEKVVPDDQREELRFRIEHAQIVHPDDIVRFRDLSVLPSMQPTHLSSDMPWAPERVGEARLEGAYAWTAFHRLGLATPFGSDFPVERPNPLLGLYAAITARAPGRGPVDGYLPERRLSRLRALQGFTRDAAFAAFREAELGTLEPGRIADFTVFDRDLMTCDLADLPDARVLMTSVGGRVHETTAEDASTGPSAANLRDMTAQVEEFLTVLASDEMAGRNTPSPELERAADWIVEKFESFGVEPGPDGWFHNYELPGIEVQGETTVCQLVGSDGHVLELVSGAEFRVFSGGRPFREDGIVVAGATGDGDAEQRRGLAGRSARVLVVSPESPLWAAADGNRKILSRGPGAAPVVLLKDDVARRWIEQQSLEELRVNLQVPAPIESAIPLRNVVGMIKGTDLQDEFLVVSAHYDHIGLNTRGGEDVIFNGADDDATGTVAVLSVAKALAESGFSPRRSILFVTFSAEEKGLLGSRKFVETPPVSLESIRAVVNIEMLGRPEEDTDPFFWVTGKSKSDFDQLAAESMERAGVEMRDFRMGEQLFFASDNAPFARAGVIAHSISAGTLHRDYHQPNDEVDRIDHEHMAAVVLGLIEVVKDFSTRDRMPVWAEGAEESLQGGGRRGGRRR